jgi:branched-chain amino acid transport system substrate-binding protein
MEKKISRKMEFRSALPLLILLTVCALGLNFQPAFAQDTVPGVTKDSIKIGVFAPLTGEIAVYGKAAHMADAIFHKVNQEGGINGRKIIPILMDTGCNPLKGVAAVKKLIYEDQVFMLHGSVCSNVALAAKKEILETKIPFVVLGAASYKITTPLEKNIFTGVFTSESVAKSMADFAMTKPGVKRVGVIKHTDEWAKSFYVPLIEYLKTKYHIVPVADVTIERGVSDATPQILKLKEAKPDVIIAVTYVVSTSTIIRDAYKLGLNVPIVGSPAVAVDEQSARVGIPQAMEQFFSPYWYKYSFDNPKMIEWENLLHQYYPKDKFDMFAGLGIGGTIAIVQALKKAGPDLTREKFDDALEKTRDLNKWAPLPFPMATPINYSPTDHVGIDQMAFSVMYHQKVHVVYNWGDYLKLKK